MHRTLVSALIVVILTALAGSTLAETVGELGTEKAETDESTILALRLNNVMEVVLDRHFDPPTWQQMILDGTKTLYRVAKQPAPRGLSRQVSELVTTGQLAKYLDDLRSDFKWKPERLETTLVHGMLGTVSGDARLIASADLKVQGQLSANRYVGTGIVLSMSREEERPVIPKVFYNGPAWKAGVKAGDLILEIDEQDTQKMPLARVIGMLRGEEDSVVQIKVRQPEEHDPRTLKVTRGVAFIPTVDGYQELSASKWQYIVDSTDHLAYIRINRIGSSTLHELRQVEAKLGESEIRGVILDLRYGGGTLHDTVMVADGLINQGTIGRVRSAEKVQRYQANPGALFRQLPMAVLIDRTAQSDREFLAAALQDNRQAVVVGEGTSGRGFVRQAYPIPGRKQEIVLATAILERGDGTSLLASQSASTPVERAALANQPAKHLRGGVVPDHAVSLTQDRRLALLKAYSNTSSGLKQPADDPLIDQAVEVLQSLPRAAS